MKSIKRSTARAAKRAAKAARFAARRDPKDSNTKYSERKKARERGVPMASRTHERLPWWNFNCGAWVNVFTKRRLESWVGEVDLG